MREDAIAVARKVLASPAGEIAELWVRPFEDEDSGHDDALQDRLGADFAAAFDKARSELAAEFGPPARAGEDDDETVPLCGVFRFAVWSMSDREMWLAAAHEDRECPFLLVLGTAP
jgi:hypothetical protein